MSDLLHLIDFHRDCFTIIPDENGEHRTFLVPFSGKEKKIRIFCSCCKKSYAQCENSKKLQSIYQTFFQDRGVESPTRDFEKSILWSLVEPVTKFRTDSVYSVKLVYTKDGLNISDKQNKEILCCYENGSKLERFVSRITDTQFSRYFLMNRAAEFVQTEQERALLNAGHKTQRQIIEESIWYRVAYHCFREYNGADLRIKPSVDKQNGEFSLQISTGAVLVFRIAVPNGAVQSILQVLQKYKVSFEIQIDKEESELYYRVWKKENEICIGPVVKVADRLKSVKIGFVHGAYLYNPEFNRYLLFSNSSVKLIATGRSAVIKIRPEELSSFLVKNEGEYSFERRSVDGDPIELNLFTNTEARGFGRIIEPVVINFFDRIQLNPLSIDEKNCVLEVFYCSGDTVVRLSEILEQKKKRNRFIYCETGIVDLGSERIQSALIKAKGASDGTISLSKAALLQFRGDSLITRIDGEEKLVSQIRQMLKFKPLKELEPVEGLQCVLREYQKLAVQWLLFLYDNHFGGLLCDDMGLGKTIQIIAFFVALKEQRSCGGAFLVVCPTSVISHWEKLMQMFTPSLKVATYHTSSRDGLLNEEFDVLLTSYGIMRNDISKLQKEVFEVAIFDEVHQLKNKETLSFQAAVEVNASIKIGVSGTPIENRISDLKALFDLVLPGLFQKENYHDEDFLALLEQGAVTEAEHLKKLITPFMMRRLKEAVLMELPAKIEDIRVCRMNPEQGELYRAAVRERGGPIVEQLKNSSEPIPYMHIFSLLTFLKQLCDHPALAAGRVQDYESYQSAKWDLFTELLDESLSSGQKVVVFSQFVGMVEIIGLYLEKRGIGHVVLTGESRLRDKIINKFAEDQGCRVFVGSIKAGGVGIDLVAGSVLIHYDRWWNPAREDQATDRVHRIGQKNVVQVFKLVTEDTVEERIGKIIERKKILSKEILIEDSPDSIKNFSRDELLGLLSNT